MHIFPESREKANNNHFTRVSNLRKKRRGALWNGFFYTILIFLLPIYPVFGNYLYQKQVTTADLIDESTIIDIGDYIVSDATVSIDDSGFIEPSLVIEESRDWGDRDDISTYVVQSGDTISALAESFGVSIGTIKWANHMTKDTLKVGQKLVILPVTGVLHKVESGEGISKLADLYDTEVDDILAANQMIAITDLKIDQSIIIPGAKPIPEPEPIVVAAPRYVASTTSTTPTTTANHSYAAPSTYVAETDANGWYPLTVEVSSGCRNFAYGHCTCFVAKHKKNVNWRGNAKDWLANARTNGWPTGSTPTPGAIVVYQGPGTHPLYGHVAIVRKVNNDGTMYVSDMNYRRWNEVTHRLESQSQRAIIGYIYVD